MLLVLLWISPLLELIKNRNGIRRRNILAKKFFQIFKQENFVNSFMTISSTDSDITHSKYTFYNIVDRLKKEHKEFQSLPEPQIALIREHFTFWNRWYGYFKRKIDFNSFSTLLEDFGSMVSGYHRICISEPLTNIYRINKNGEIKISEEIKKDWKTAMGYYDDFEKRYNHFVNQVNGEFKETILPSLPPAQEL
ncbi:MAG: hypothetical protein C3F06_07290 [Candidatus Methanoperedenaceae archaeon]|nr:MAG: hypothetical protein C3F06_07290 [Candidatus Methanoperedenaceae archaeon]